MLASRATRLLGNRPWRCPLEETRGAKICTSVLCSTSSASHIGRRSGLVVVALCSKEDLLEPGVVRNGGQSVSQEEEEDGADRNNSNFNNGSMNIPTTSSSLQEAAPAATPQRWQDNLRQYSWLAFWVIAAIAFGSGIWAIEGPTKGKEFFAGYLLEQCLSLDNLFVFQLVFSYFRTPESGQASVLTYGITTAAVLRAVLILAGVQLVEQWKPVLLVFAGILIFSSFKLLTEDKSGEDGGEDLSQNMVLQVCRRFIRTTDAYDGDKFFTMLADGTRCATPLLLALAVVELSDVVFALDSIPAIFGVTVDPFIVYTSNMFAILSLRAVYSFASSVMMQARYLDKAVAVVLGFIGVKLLLEFGHMDIPTDVSLLFVALVLAAGAVAGYVLPEPAEREV